MTMLNLRSKKRGRPPEPRRARTSVSFSAADLTALAELLAAGQALLRQSGPAHLVVGRLKAAMTRLHVPIPRAL